MSHTQRWGIALIVAVAAASVAAVAAPGAKPSPKAHPKSPVKATPAAKHAPKAATKPAAPAKLPRLVDLGADRCIPCRMMAPILEELRREQRGSWRSRSSTCGRTPPPDRSTAFA